MKKALHLQGFFHFGLDMHQGALLHTKLVRQQPFKPYRAVPYALRQRGPEPSS
ncbi:MULTISPECIES: hypothetical protein [Burkholderia]|uniref:hypothetical protein n=1 Tax=Burkholderia TaxID=32008 RepID=UPI00136DA978|nr:MULTISPECIES: hypothetical protein [Burkholderia]